MQKKDGSEVCGVSVNKLPAAGSLNSKCRHNLEVLNDFPGGTGFLDMAGRKLAERFEDLFFQSITHRGRGEDLFFARQLAGGGRLLAISNRSIIPVGEGGKLMYEHLQSFSASGN